MKASENCRPYNHEHAQAGAPIGLRNGCDVKIHHVVPEFDKLIGMFYGVDGTVHAGEWNLKGAYYDFGHGGRLDIIMPPVGYCEGKPVFVGDTLIDPKWWQTENQSFIVQATNINGYEFDRCKWPKPKTKNPETRMTLHEMYAVWQAPVEDLAPSLRELMNASIAHAIQDGDVFTRAQVQAVIKECADIAMRMGNGGIAYSAIHGINWDDILKGALHG